MNSFTSKIVALAIAGCIAPTMAVGDEPMTPVSELMSYNVEMDPTTAFISLYGVEKSERDILIDDILVFAKSHLGKPYRSGGKGPSSFDCSGFTSYVFKNFGIDLSASSSSQYLQGEQIDHSEIRPGDLLFFSGRGASKSRVGHVALAVDVDENGVITFIHASNTGGIRYDQYPDGGYYSRRYIGAKRVVFDEL